MASTSTTIPVLSVRQPWAHWIINGHPSGMNHKDIENRTWRPSYRGPLAIHAARGIDPDDEDLVTQEMVCGAIIGIVDLVDVVESSDSPWFSGPVGWVLAQPRVIDPPIPCRGMPGLFRPTLGRVDLLRLSNGVRA
jgi:hypothetical protein